MHSRKSILNRGIVFIASVFAMAFLSCLKVSAVCEPTFNDGTQYVTIGGDKESWDDSLIGGCDGIEISSITVNGVTVEGASVFAPEDYPLPGHYTVGYNYTYKEGEDTNSGVIYRYVRILDDIYTTSNNYTLSTFDFDKTSMVVDSFNVGNNYFANFVLVDNSTYLVIKDALGRDVIPSGYSSSKVELKFDTNSMSVVKVLKSGNYYYVIGNSNNRGVFVSYQITVTSGTVSISSVESFSSYSIDSSTWTIYSSGYIYGDNIYLVGRSNNGNPRIDVKTVSGAQKLYEYTSKKGEYRGVSVVDNTVYAVGYVKGDTDVISSGLYTYVENTTGYSKINVLENSASTIFNDIVYDSASRKNIIVGESAINQIYANNSIAATNNKQGYNDGIILQVSLDGTAITGAYMFGGSDNDTFKSIKSYGTDQYAVTGTMYNGIAGMTYLLKASTFEASIDVTSGSNGYRVNGMVSWDHGYAYYGELNASSVLDVYYPKEISGDHDALFVVLDNRTFSNYETVNLVKGETYRYCDSLYFLTFGGNADYESKECQENPTGVFNTTNSGVSTRLNYKIQIHTGSTIYVYRVVNVNDAPTPINLKSYETGILRWHVYNRSYTYMDDNATRYTPNGFGYRFTNTTTHSNDDIFDMIDYYFEKGNTSPYTLTYAETGYKTFTASTQTNAAFATIEAARKFAYYQEFSRVVRVSGTTVDAIGAYRYTGTGTGQQVVDGAPFFVYYIDYRGNDASSLVNACSVSPNSITNCTAKGGYAFASLNDVKTIIEYFLQYNDYFVTTRNTIYNGSVKESEIAEYKEVLNTKEYLKQVKFTNAKTNLVFNVKKEGESSAIQLENKDVYFGGKAENDTTFTHPMFENGNKKLTVSKKTQNGITYYESTEGIFFPQNMCYNVYYSYGDSSVGTSRVFCLDTIAPEIVYWKHGSGTDSNSIQSSTSTTGTKPGSPLFIESNFSIVDLIDLDEYTFIYVNGNRYTLACESSSETCEEEVKKYIRQSFMYDKNDPTTVKSITFSDRSLNENTFYFVIGTISPTVTYQENADKTGFTLNIDFYDTNPITAISTNVFEQSCAGVADGCYTPVVDTNNNVLDDNSDGSLDINKVQALSLFNEALQNYIYAISYRDNSKESESLLKIVANDGVYSITTTINNIPTTIDYIIQDGYFVEYAGYEESYAINENNLFNYNGTMYSYNAISSYVREMIWDDNLEQYIENTSKDSITILDGVFTFNENGKEYTLSTVEGVTNVVALPQKYEIYNGNLFTLNEIIYTVDFDNEVISYTNPEISTMKHISLDFLRTTSNAGFLSGGVDIPKTQRVMKDGVAVVDPKTNLPAYEIIEGVTHFNLVDGVYSFTISQNFKPYTKTVETKINVKDLEITLGYALNHTGMEVKTGFQFSFGASEDTSSTIALVELTDNFRYPLSASVVSSSSLDSYADTHFMSRPVYAAYQNDVQQANDNTTVFIIKVYDIKSAYGLPSRESLTYCHEFIIYANSSGTNPIESPGCEIPSTPETESVAMQLNQVSANKDLLARYGITQTLTNTGAFAFNGENMFYSVSLVTYRLNNDGGYTQSAVKAVRNFYIDSKGPIYDDGVNGPTVKPYVYNEDGEVFDKTFSFVENAYILNSTVGSTTNIGFKINWYKALEQDYRENKLLLMSIYDGDKVAVCNVYQLVADPTYTSECRDYIDINESINDASEFMVAFSATGAYEVTFHDASGNGVTYSFAIDKTAPIVKVIDSRMEGKVVLYETINQGSSFNYVLLSYVKNPEFTIRLEDLSSVTGYCYYFDYGQQTKTPICLDGIQTEYTFSLRDYVIGNVDADTYLQNQNEDRKVVLNVWAKDALGNSGETTATKVEFWVDYYNPSATFTKDNINTQYLTFEDIENYSSMSKTITVLSSTYSGAVVECPAGDGFTFQDAFASSIQYTFKVECSDVHTASTTDFPTTKDFPNKVYMRFYESDGTTKTGELFNFGQPTNNGSARWIYITVVDMVGNESADYTILPIIVQDEVPPYVKNQYKGNDIVITPTTYQYPNGEETLVYLANDRVKLIFSEPIRRLKSCNVIVSTKDSVVYTGVCDNAQYGDGYVEGTTYLYTELMTQFEFNNVIDEHYKVVVIEVEDFAALSSGRITIIIDKIAPTIAFDEENDGGADASIEYIKSSVIYGDSYKESGYVNHVYATDDQDAALTVNVEYSKYLPSTTYKNYVMRSGKFEYVEDGTPRNRNTKYYLLIKSNLLDNKTCVKAEDIYCYVEDTQSYYYFDSLLTDESGDIWKDTITEINSSTVGVYRISYSVTDYAGNTSTKIYKKVFVNDTYDPDIDIYDSTAKVKLYGNLTSDNPDNFEGKLNQVVAFKGTDVEAKDSDTRIVLYKCDIIDYQNGTCNIDQPLYSSDEKASRGESTSNLYSIGSKLKEGVYKTFVYDFGQYKSIDANGIKYNGSSLANGETVYSLTHNASAFYFAIRIRTIEAKYVVNGNKYTSAYEGSASYISYNYSQTNYYTITNGSDVSDVYLVRYNKATQTYDNASGTNAIGYAGVVDYVSSNGVVTVSYKDAQGRIVYEIKYKEYDVEPDGSNLMLHETYHNIDLTNKTVEVCKVVNGVNPCDGLPTVYQVVSVRANIYEEGEYQIKMVDRYGNYSQDTETFNVDNTAFMENKDLNKPTGVNYWYSVPSQVVTPLNKDYLSQLVGVAHDSDINVLEEVYTNNFNSSFFYAFASKADAKAYLTSVYRSAISTQFAQGLSFTFYSIDGSSTKTYLNESVDDVMLEITSSLSNMIFTTYTKNKNFSDSAVQQIAYAGSVSTSMYEYAYLLVTTKISASGVVSYEYTLAGDTCEAQANQECVKVELKIVSATNNSIVPNQYTGVNTIQCKVSGTFDSGSGCKFNTITSGARYIFIDSDVNKYHTNIVYYGVTAYTEAADITFNDIGEFVPLTEFERYSYEEGNTYVKDVNGSYIWLNSKFVHLDDILTTNLYSKTCTFNSEDYSGCVYVTYLSRFNLSYDGATPVYTPSASGIYYYNYYDGNYYEKTSAMEELVVDSTYSDQGNRCNSANCNNVPLKINSTVIKTSFATIVERPINKKAYIELFNETTNSKLFEVKTVMIAGRYTEVYSYATVTINGIYYNLNNSQYLTIGADGTTYSCIIDIELEKEYNIVITDRAGNQLKLTFTHSSVTPEINYSKDDESSTSNVTISVETESTISNLIKNNVKVYKYQQGSYVEYNNSTCLTFLEELTPDAKTKFISMRFKYDAYVDCAGVYKVEVSDTHGNTNYKEFVYNPYNIQTSYKLEGNNIHEYMENDTYGVVVNNSIKVDVNATLNYVVINKYEAYTNLDLQEPISTLEITDFTVNPSSDMCAINIAKINDDNYSIYINGADDHSCDGIYTVDIVNRFSKEIKESQFNTLEGANQELITYRVNYNNATTIELDTTAPDTSVMNSETEQRFALHIDEGAANYTDTKLLMEDDEKTITYTNKYITVSWGGYASYSLTYLKHRVITSQERNDPWVEEKTNVKYDYDYSASYLFKITETGVYTIEFMFFDAVGNEDANEIFTLIITIEAPKVGFYETNENGSIIGELYQQGQRIADRTILQCSIPVGSSYILGDCTTDDYTYYMTVNGIEAPRFYDDEELRDVISRNSYWLINHQEQYADELIISLTVSVKGKPDIYTNLLVVIDKKAPTITLTGSVVGSTYTGDLTISISQDDASNNAIIYRCDKMGNNEECLILDSNKNYIEGSYEVGVIEKGVSAKILDNTSSGYFIVLAQDDLGNSSTLWFVLDNQAPTISVKTSNTVIAPNMYTNANAVYVEVKDELSETGSMFDIQFIPFNEEDADLGGYVDSVGLTKEGKYILTPTDGVGKVGRAITFYIYRQAPKYTTKTNNKENSHVVNTEVSLDWEVSDNELVAPIVSVTVDGRLYEAEYNSVDKKYVGKVIKTIGEHTFVLTDAAGNRSITMVTINNTKNVCINGVSVEVKMQAYYNVDNLLIGNEEGMNYEVNDVIIFALPSQVTSGDCMSNGLLGYRTLDPQNSHYLIDNQRNAETFNKTETGLDFVNYGFISQEAINEIKNVGGTVVVFVVTKAIANDQLGYKVGTNFFMEDPIGWSVIFAAAISMVWPTCRIFIKKKVRVI